MSVSMDGIARRAFMTHLLVGVAATNASAQSMPKHSRMYLMGALAHRRSSDQWNVWGLWQHDAMLVVRDEDMSEENRRNQTFQRFDASQHSLKQLRRLHPTVPETDSKFWVLCLSGLTCEVDGNAAPSEDQVRMPDISTVRKTFGLPDRPPPVMTIGTSARFAMNLRGGVVSMPQIKTMAPAHAKEFVFRRPGYQDVETRLSDVHLYSSFQRLEFKFSAPGVAFKHAVAPGAVAWLVSGSDKQTANPNVLVHGSHFFELFGDAGEVPVAQTMGLKKKTGDPVDLPCVSLVQLAAARASHRLIPPDTDFCYQAWV